MASTNKTANLGLSQFADSDKPTYLVDYNNDMAAVDAGTMPKATYDPPEAGQSKGPVELAGGISAYAMPKATYDPTGAVAAAGGIPGYVSGWVTGSFTNPNASVITGYGMRYDYNRSMSLLCVRGYLAANRVLISGDAIFNFSDIPGFLLPLTSKVFYSAVTFGASTSPIGTSSLAISPTGIVTLTELRGTASSAILCTTTLNTNGWGTTQ